MATDTPDTPCGDGGEEMLDLDEVARRLGVSRDTVWRRIMDGWIPGYDVGTDQRSLWRVKASDVATYLETRRWPPKQARP